MSENEKPKARPFDPENPNELLVGVPGSGDWFRMFQVALFGNGHQLGLLEYMMDLCRNTKEIAEKLGDLEDSIDALPEAMDK